MRIGRMLLVGLASGMVAGCSGDSATEPAALPNVVGTWRATKVEFISVSNPATKLEMISQGATMTVVLGAAKTLTITQTAPGQTTEVSTGTYSETATTLKITITSETPASNVTFTMVLSGTTLTLTGGQNTFDFGSGEVPATINLTLSKQ